MFSRESALFKVLQRRFRAKRFQYILRMIQSILAERGEVSILDAGGRAEYWRLLPPALRDRVHVTVLNYSSELVTYAVERGDGLRITDISGDACDMPQFADRSFDLVHSNSVIEHVGSYRNMMKFANEMRRVGRAYYVQTPNFWFPVDPHYGVLFFHWLPDPVRAWLFSRIRVGFAARCGYLEAVQRIDDCRIVSRRLIKHLFPDGIQRSERFMVMLTKSLIVSRQQSAG